jgi:hypothetical protein
MGLKVEARRWRAGPGGITGSASTLLISGAFSKI